MKPYYEDNDCSIYHADCLELLSSLSGRPFDMTLTDPPYNYGLNYGPRVNDSRSRHEYIEWCKEWWGEVRRLSNSIVLFPGNGNLDVWWQVSRPSAVGCWYKPGNGASSLIGFEEWEPWLFWSGNNALTGGSSVITARTVKQLDASDHPCPKPLSLMTLMLRKFKNAATVLDPFMGSGTTLLAAKRLGRKSIGVEIEERYCEIAAKRLSQQILLPEEVA